MSWLNRTAGHTPIIPTNPASTITRSAGIVHPPTAHNTTHVPSSHKLHPNTNPRNPSPAALPPRRPDELATASSIPPV